MINIMDNIKKDDIRFEYWIVNKIAEKGFKGFELFEERKEVVDKAYESIQKNKSLYTLE